MTSSGTPHVPLDSSDVPRPIRRRHTTLRQLPPRHGDPATGEELPSYHHGEPWCVHVMLIHSCKLYRKTFTKSFCQCWNDILGGFLIPNWNPPFRWIWVWCRDGSFTQIGSFCRNTSKLCTNLSIDSKRRCPSLGCLQTDVQTDNKQLDLSTERSLHGHIYVLEKSFAKVVTSKQFKHHHFFKKNVNF